MKQFYLEEYLKNPDRKIVTRDNRPAKIICTDRKFEFLNAQYPVMALIKGFDNDSNEISFGFTSDGKKIYGFDDNTDLFFVPEKKEKWANVYRSPVGVNWLGKDLYDTEKAAKADTSKSRVATVKIEWEE